ncbi:MAG: hypothetical protein P8J14_13180 [Emcibacteraceae bacterium]|nr:hypothetical protein [Emcibacteraceae bacterium]
MIKKLSTLSLSICSLLIAQTTAADSLPTGHAPIGVMGDHTHLKGEWMASYRYGRMGMENKLIDTGDILNGAMMAPKTMKREMHMLGMMHGLTDKITLMGAVPFIKTEMTMDRAMGSDFTTKSNGIGDVKIGGLYTLFQKDHRKVIFNLILSIPTGTINDTDDTPMMAAQMLSPNMQPGSGTYDVMTKVTYIDRQDDWAWGAQLGNTLRTGTNDNGYKTGNRIAASAWIARDLANFVSVSLRIDSQKWGDTKLNDVNIMNLYGGERIDLLTGINFIIPEGALKGNRFAIEFGKPIHQDTGLNQMENDYRLHAGWQLAF